MARIFRALEIFSVRPRLATACLLFLLTAEGVGQNRAVDLVVVNGNVHTLDAAKPRAEAFAVSRGKIVAVGSDRMIRALAGRNTRVIDAKGRLVLPGFNDAHVHFAAIGNKFSSIDLRGVRSAEEVAARLAEYARFLPKGRWILGGGFDREAAAGERGRLQRLVDAVTAGNPVFVYSADAKTAFANSAALLRAGITRTTSDPPRGSIGRSDGEPDGILSGTAIRLVESLVPKDHAKNWPEVLETATNYAASLGVTSVQDMHSDEMADVYRQLDRAGKLKTRVYDCAPLAAAAKLAAAGVKAATGDAMVRTGCVKYFSEGDEAEIPQLRRQIAAADKAGLQVMIHAIGPDANAIVLDAFEYAAKTNGPRDRRFRVEHAHNPADEDLPRFARSGVNASVQPWLFNGTDTTVYKRHLELGTRLAFGSDASIVEFNPLLAIFAATQGPGAISLESAVRAYTIGSAFAEFQENTKGTIAVGKVADFVILDRDIFTIPISEIPKVAVATTYVDGRELFASR